MAYLGEDISCLPSVISGYQWLAYFGVVRFPSGSVRFDLTYSPSDIKMESIGTILTDEEKKQNSPQRNSVDFLSLCV